MKRLFWVAVGATVGVLVVRRLNQKADQLTPAGLAEGAADQVVRLAAVAREVAEEVRAEMTAGEDQIRSSLGLDAPADAPETAAGARTEATETNGRYADVVGHGVGPGNHGKGVR